MKATLLRLVLSLVMVGSLASCTTAYDAYGNPQQVVTPEGAVLGAAAVGLLAYGLSQNNNNRRYDDRRYYGRRSYSSYHRGHYHH